MADCTRYHRCHLRRELDANAGLERAWFECFNCGSRWGWNDWIVDESSRTVRLGDLFEFTSPVDPEGPEIFESGND